MKENKNGLSDDYDFDFSGKSGKSGSGSGKNGFGNAKNSGSPGNFKNAPSRSPSATGKKRKSKQKKYRIPKKERMPASIIALYIAIAVLILGICAVIFLISFNNEKAKQSGIGNNSGLITQRDTSSDNSSDGESTSLSATLSVTGSSPAESSVTVSSAAEETYPQSSDSTESIAVDGTESDIQDSAGTPTEDYDVGFFSDDLFIGDSIYTGLYLYGFIPMENVAASVGYTPYKARTEAFGDSGLTAVEYAEQLSPKHIIIMLGSNEMAGGGDIAAITESYKELVAELNRVCPDSAICVVSVPPVTADSSLAADSDISNSVIDIFNGFLSEYCADSGIAYFDLNSLLSDENGFFKEEYAEADGLHFLSGAYEVMLSGLESCLDYTQTFTPTENGNAAENY